MDKSDGISEFMNAKSELSMALQQLTAISENFFLAVELPQENLLAIKTDKLHQAVNTVDSLVNILSDIVGDSEEFEDIEDTGEQECALETNGDKEKNENQVEVAPDLGINPNGKDEPEIGSKVVKLVSSVKRKLAEKEVPGKVSKKLKRGKKSKLLDVSEMPNSTGGYSCQTCEKTFTQRRNLIVHIKTVHERIRIPCSMCDHTASTKSNLKVHMVKKHDIEMDNSVNYGVIVDSVVEDHDINKDEVVIDGYEVQTGEIDSDIEDYGVDTEEGVETIQEEYDAEVQDNVEDNENVPNDSVVYMDNNKADESDTLEISNGTEGYQCEKCNKTFTQKRNLQVHVKTVHEGIRIPCSMCDHTASTKSNLRKHMAKKHNVDQ